MVKHDYNLNSEKKEKDKNKELDHKNHRDSHQISNSYFQKDKKEYTNDLNKIYYERNINNNNNYYKNNDKEKEKLNSKYGRYGIIK
jgi:hypothetical protein